MRVCTEIEMVVMEKCKVSELTEQNITDEEKTAAATRTHTQRSRYMHTHLNTHSCQRKDRSVHGLMMSSVHLQTIPRHGVQCPRLHQ